MTKRTAEDAFVQVSPVQKAISAISGAVMTSLIVTPLDVVKTRLQSQSINQPDPMCCRETYFESTLLQNSPVRARLQTLGTFPGAASCSPSPDVCVAEETALKRFTGTWEGLVKIARHEGISSLWRGLSPTLFMAVPSTVIYFVGYEQLRAIVNNDSAWAPLLCGGLARTASATVISPLELLRTRLQSASHQGSSASESFKETTRGIREMVRADGVRTLWRGLNLTLMRDVPFSAFYWLGYERTKTRMVDAGVTSPFLQSFISGGISGTFAALITTPFDVAKTKRQVLNRTTDGNQSMWQLMKTIHAEEGLKGLWRGTIPRCLKVSPACAIMISSYEICQRHIFAGKSAIQ
ncbi:putative Mitochondrial carrier protein [Taphrina deformans PYCC 5710]|uniref:Mitochondrial carrier protein n=1 Tax=Taphrina deformans (strain PYCC 5710 / ATCC 11124 / CBS 356.35 / IMI 108563 / JCM 9778 / NBRC 8474) TaxID=1097556 RepID=R4XBK3_TAPDE|nr:putative Mitochondrial carrier protein [Taphrina deformans PYCC 5710]|eukprot:CCG80718.1 putative Mitochondrial carrier protein [Taphrina deformans PYCC 5710]